MNYSDEELKIATDLAYMDLHKAYEKLNSDINVVQAIEYLIKNHNEDLSDNEVNHYREIIDKIEAIEKRNNVEWKIVDYKNDNKKDQTGLYGIVLDTGDGHIVAFRGSESMLNSQHALQDWSEADLALLKPGLTEQQKKVNEFLEEINNSDYITKYDNVAFTGHSLGGNLAIHGSIMSTFYENIFPRIRQAVNFDGPGYSKEYLAEYKEQIELISEKLDGEFRHYQWSVVGAILNPATGINFETLATKATWNPLNYLVMEHSTSNLIIDETTGKAKRETNLVNGGKSQWELMFGKFTESIDHLWAPVGSFLVDALGGILVFVMYYKVPLAIAVGGAVLALVAIGGIPALAVIGQLILAVVAIVVTVIAFGATIESMLELFSDLFKEIGKVVGNALKWTNDKINQLIDFMSTKVSQIRDWFNHVMKSYGYAVATPVIEVNTDKLRQYAERLENVRKRLQNLDADMNSLYFTNGFLDLLDIIRANRLPNSMKLKFYINYLEDTAEAFEKAERNIIEQV
ncbi:Mbeg1-like protein [Caldifermentibacillus hisashii]|uniref:Mbeg1-like protein n=1 Tax=Caldifermentibacillus hisashii TaxID=996558 RepID=UPI003136D01F